jgi:hypothetical protein
MTLIVDSLHCFLLDHLEGRNMGAGQFMVFLRYYNAQKKH